MIITKKQFDEIGPWHFNDLCFDSTNQTMMLNIFNLLPSHLQGKAVSWGCNDSVFRDDVFEYLCENQFGMSTEEYYESDKFNWFIKKRHYQQISIDKLKLKTIQVDIEREDIVDSTGGFGDTRDYPSGNGYAKGELGIIMAPDGHGKVVHFEDMMKNVDVIEMMNRKRDKNA